MSAEEHHAAQKRHLARKRENEVMMDEEIIQRAEQHETIAYAEFERLVDLARTAAALQERVRELEIKLEHATDMWGTEERARILSNAAGAQSRSREAKLRSALEPFAALYDEIDALAKGQPEGWSKACQWVDLRAARAALNGDTSHD